MFTIVGILCNYDTESVIFSLYDIFNVLPISLTNHKIFLVFGKWDFSPHVSEYTISHMHNALFKSIIQNFSEEHSSRLATEMFNFLSQC